MQHAGAVPVRREIRTVFVLVEDVARLEGVDRRLQAHHVQVAPKQDRRALRQIQFAPRRHRIAVKGHVLVGFALAFLLIGRATTTLQVRRREERRHAIEVLCLNDHREAAVDAGKRLAQGPRAGHHQIVIVLHHIPRGAGQPRFEQAFDVGRRDVVDLAESNDVGLQRGDHAPHGRGRGVLVHAAVDVPPHRPKLRASTPFQGDHVVRFHSIVQVQLLGRGRVHFVVVGVDPLPRQAVAAHPGHVTVQRQLEHVAAVRRRTMQADVVEAQRRRHPTCVVADDFVLGKIHHQLHPHVLLNPTGVGVAVGVNPQLQPVRNDGLIQGQILAQRHLPKHPVRIGRRRATQHVGVRGHRSGRRKGIPV